MWPFSRKKPAQAVPAPPAQAQTAAQPPAFSSTHDMIAATIHAARGDGAHFARYYATMCGFRGATLGSHNIAEFLRLIEQEPVFTDRNVNYAAISLVSDMDAILQSDYGDHTIYGVGGEKNGHLHGAVEAVRRDAQVAGFRSLCEVVGFDIADFLKTTTISLRANDLVMIAQQLAEKKEALIPILRRALHGHFRPTPITPRKPAPLFASRC